MLFHTLVLLSFQFVSLTQRTLENKEKERPSKNALLGDKLWAIDFLKNKSSVVKNDDVMKLLDEKLRPRKYAELGVTCPCALLQNGKSCGTKCMKRNCKIVCEVPVETTTTTTTTTASWPDLYEERCDVAVPLNPTPKPCGKCCKPCQEKCCCDKEKNLEDGKSSPETLNSDDGKDKKPEEGRNSSERKPPDYENMKFPEEKMNSQPTTI
ncbi:UNVERIFIED_CONTAM: hypothetical protein RMT77_009551 [Armadillidium vulgare]